MAIGACVAGTPFPLLIALGHTLTTVAVDEALLHVCRTPPIDTMFSVEREGLHISHVEFELRPRGPAITCPTHGDR